MGKTETPIDPRDTPHGQQIPEPTFGPGSDYDPNKSILEKPTFTNDDPGERALAAQDKAESSPSLSNREATGGTGNHGAVGEKEKGLSDKLGKGFTGNALNAAAGAVADATPVGRAARMFNFFKRNKKKSAAGGIGTIGTVGAFLAFGFFQGVLLPIHIGEALQNAFGGQEDAAAVRTQGVFRAISSGKIGETRISAIGSRMKNNIVGEYDRNGNLVKEGQFTREGIRIYTSSATQPTIYEIDTKKNTALKGLTGDNLREAVREKFGLAADKSITLGEYGTKARFSARNASQGEHYRILRTLTKDLPTKGLGKILNSIRARPTIAYYGVASPLHPMKRAQYKALAKGIAKGDLKAYRELKAKQEEERKQRVRDARAEGSNRTEVVNEAKEETSKAKGLLTKVVGTQLIVCTTHAIAKRTDEVNRDRAVIPWMNLATDAMGHGEQGKSGNDFLAEQMEVFYRGLTDKDGKLTTTGKGMHALLNSRGGEEMDPEAKKAFLPDSNARKVVDAMDGVGAKYFCSTPAIILGIATQFIGAGSLKAASVTVGKIVVGGLVLHEIIEHASKVLADDYVKPSIAGPDGGNGITAGVISLAKADGTSNGGAQLSSGESKLLYNARLEEDKKNFQTKNFASRIFDAKDYRSLTGRFINQGSSSPQRNIASLVSKFGSMSSVFVPKIFAAEQEIQSPNEWLGLAENGFSQEELNSDVAQDSSENPDAVVPLLTGKNIKKAKNCFGVKIEKDSEDHWDVIKDHDVNTNTKEYEELDCRDKGNGDWLRIRFFIFDTPLVDALACYEIDESCDKFGFGSDQETVSAQNDNTAIEGLEDISDVEIKKTDCSSGSAPGDCYQLPKSKYWDFWGSNRYPDRWKGSKCMVDLIAATSKTWLSKYPEDKVRVGDVNAAGHRSHRLGEDVDINTPTAADETQSGYSTGKTIEYGKLWLSTESVEYIGMNDPQAIKALIEYAKEKGLKSYPVYWNNHADHFHVRVHTPKSDGSCSSAK